MTVADALHQWVAEQPLWQQDLAIRLLEQPELSDEHRAEALQVVLAAHGALGPDEQVPEARAVQRDHFLDPVPDRAPRLHAFGRMRGVGSVTPDAELTFQADGLTTVFGANAAGKSTYVRGLKRLCRTVDLDSTLLGNVFAVGADEEQTAQIATAAGTDSPVARRVNLRTRADVDLSSVSVFDARSAELYVDEDNSVAYVPSSLLLLARLAATQERMRADVQRLISAVRSGSPRFGDLPEQAQAGEQANALTADTDLDDLTRFVTLSREERDRQTELRAAVAAAEARDAQADAAAADRDAAQAGELVRQLGRLAQAIAPEAADALRAAATEAASAREAAQAVTAEFASLPVSGIGGDAWRRMWTAARELLTTPTSAGAYPPTAGEHCPYCLQTLDAEAAERLTHFERHVTSALAERADAAERELKEALDRLQPRLVEECRGPFLAALAATSSDLHRRIDEYLAASQARLELMHENPAGAGGAATAAEDPRMALTTWGQGRTRHAETLRLAADARGAGRLRLELQELDARQTLAARMDDVRSLVADLKRVRALNAAHHDLATNRVTRCQSDLSRTAVTDVLQANLRKELGALHCEHLPVELSTRGAMGETRVALRLAGAAGAPRVSDILSEGEQRALSLAFFLAEVATADHDGGIIVDDPTSSLDDERRAYIARRLTEEAKRRQVIVFTHDLILVTDLVSQAKQLNVPHGKMWVWRLGTEAGRVDHSPPFRAMNFGKRVGALTDRVERWDQQSAPASQDEALQRVTTFYRDLRLAWERAVEERLFRGVVERFQREVKTLRLSEVDISSEDIRDVEDGMTRCSNFLHDPAASTVTGVPGREDLARDLESLRAFEVRTRSGG
jgi:energy-coupling factor transporter ATP-binding protein EcfA2